MIGYSRQQITDEDISAVKKVLESNWLTQGPAISFFEEAVCNLTGAKYAVAVSNATAGLHISLLACSIGRGRHISVPTNTFVSTANVGVMAGANVEFIDTDPETGNLNMDFFNHYLASKTDVVIPVHFGGLPVDVKKLHTLINSQRTIIIEDASHALGARYPDGSKVGSCKYSKCTIFSFHPVKIVTTGEGGIVTTNDEDIYKNLLRLRSHGITKLDDAFVNKSLAFENGHLNPWYYEMQMLGYNYRLTDIQAALGVSQLNRLEENFEKRQNVANFYDGFFKNLQGIVPLQAENRALNAHHLYPIMVDFKNLKISRRQLIEKLKEKGIGTQVHYIPVHLQPFYKGSEVSETIGKLNGAMEYYQKTLSIPLYPDLTPSQQEYVVDTLKNILNLDK